MSEHSIRCAKCAGTGRATRTNGRTGLKEICPWGWKDTKGGRVRNRRHVCSEVCGWSYQRCLQWLAETPYHTAGAETIQATMDYTGWASCLCGKSARHHVEPKANPDGTLAGYGEVDCEYRNREAVAPELAA